MGNSKKWFRHCDMIRIELAEISEAKWKQSLIAGTEIASVVPPSQ
ncbi:MAG: hypothetical protein V1781_05290 [Bacteroidota bacterium]